MHNIWRGRGQGGEGEGEGQCTGEERCKHATNCVQARSGTACKHAAHASGEASAASTKLVCSTPRRACIDAGAEVVRRTWRRRAMQHRHRDLLTQLLLMRLMKVVARRKSKACATLAFTLTEFWRQVLRALRPRCDPDLSRTDISSKETRPSGKYETIISKIFLKGYCLSERCATYVVFRLVFLRGRRLYATSQ